MTGLPAIAARNSAKLISEMNWGLVGDIFVIFIFLGIALRSVMAGVSSALPSLFPIFATGALLWATGQGMQFASIMALTVAFSLAIDSTIHFLNRFRLEEERIGPGANSAHDALMATAHHIGPAVVLTTIVLALGLGVTMLSDLPSLRLFGQLAGICLVRLADRPAHHPSSDDCAIPALFPAARVKCSGAARVHGGYATKSEGFAGWAAWQRTLP